METTVSGLYSGLLLWPEVNQAHLKIQVIVNYNKHLFEWNKTRQYEKHALTCGSACQAMTWLQRRRVPSG